MDKGISNIALICDDKYLLPAIVLIKSIDENVNQFKLSIHVIGFNLSQDSFDRLNSLCVEHVDIYIHHIDEEYLRSRVGKVVQHSHVTMTSLLKFELPNILNGINSVLYLDTDIVIKKNIYELLRIDFEDYYIAAAPELWCARANHESGITYFNSGVLLINLDLCRVNNISNRLWIEKQKLLSNKSSKTMDQDALNIVFRGKTKYIPVEYNMNPYFMQGRYLELVNNYAIESYRNVEEVSDNIAIIHYVGNEDKPWVNKNARLGKVWDEYYLKCGYKLESLERIEIKKNVRYYVKMIYKLINNRGVINTIKYLWRM